MRRLTEEQRHTIVHGLMVAAERFADDATLCPTEPAHRRLRRRLLHRQFRETMELVDSIESAEYIELGLPERTN